jgi:hypothetical protein
MNPKMLFQVSLRTADDRMGQCPPRKRWVITTIKVCNTTNSNITFRLHHAMPGKASDATNPLFYDTRVAANTTTSLLSGGDRMPVNENEDIRGQASSTGVVVTGYGIEEDA